MGRKRQDLEDFGFVDISDKTAYRMCSRKRKYKSSEAGRKAAKFGQRKYECSICGHWHLTKMKGFVE